MQYLIRGEGPEPALGKTSLKRGTDRDVAANGRKDRTADLGALDYAAPCHEGPVWGSRAAAMAILANDRNGPHPASPLLGNLSHSG